MRGAWRLPDRYQPRRDLVEPRPLPAVLPTQPSAPSGGIAGLGREMSPQGNYSRPSPINVSSFIPLAQEVSLRPIRTQSNKRP